MPGQPRIVLNSKLYYLFISAEPSNVFASICGDVAMASGLKSNKMRPPLPLSVCLYLGIFDKIREERSGGAVRAKWDSNRRRRQRVAKSPAALQSPKSRRGGKKVEGDRSFIPKEGVVGIRSAGG